jgi:ATP-dependent DNA helicase PIF1
MLFGGKVVVMGGDFRQILPVVPRGTRGQIVDANLKRSAVLWHRVKVCQLHENMHVLRLLAQGGANAAIDAQQ